MDTILLPQPERDRWRLLRAGIQNVWEYDDQRFVFHRGRLLLRGRNESGKTKALEVLLPFLLDADLSPERLDPFGSTARPMHWNLLNENNEEVKLAIGYVWLEFGRVGAGGPEFCTIGAGLRAKRDSTSKVDAWYFITSLRVDVDLHPLDGERVPLPRSRFEAAIGESGKIFERDSQGYRNAVNARLFGMPEEQYRILIEALLQLRRPQLSKQLDTKELSRILTASLPSLDTRVIRPLAEGFERLDHHRDERADWQRTLEFTRAFLQVYKDYVAAVAKARAQDLTRADSAYQSARAAARLAQSEQETAVNDQKGLLEDIARLTRWFDGLSERVRTLETSDEGRAVKELEHAEQRASEDASAAGEAAGRAGVEAAAVNETRARLATLQSQAEAQADRVHSARQTSETRALDAALRDEHAGALAMIDSGDIDASRNAIESVTSARDQAIKVLERLNRDVERVANAAAEADKRLREAEDRVHAAEESLTQAESACSVATDAFKSAVSTWVDSLEVLVVDRDARAALLSAEVDDMRATAEGSADRTRHVLDEQIAARRSALAEMEKSVEALVAERNERLVQPDRPAAPSWRDPRPLDRPGAPLYMLCDFVAGIEGAAQIEAALVASGLLDAWVMPDGELLDPKTHDAILIGSPVSGRTLADALCATETGGVARETIERVLSTIRFVEAGATPPAEGCWIAADGRFCIGPVRGTAEKSAPAFIGETSRERARQQRLAEIETLLAELDAEKSVLATGIERLRSDRQQIAVELSRFPNLRPVLEARAQVEALAKQLGTERAAHDTANRALVRANEQARSSVRTRDGQAAHLGLTAWVDELDRLREQTHQYRVAVGELIQEARELIRVRARADEWRGVVAAAETRAALAHSASDEFAAQAARSAARASALHDAVGSTRDEFLACLHQAKEEQETTRKTLDAKRAEQTPLGERVGEARTTAEEKMRAVEAGDIQRKDAERGLKDLARTQLLAVADLTIDGVPDEWSFTEALMAARNIDAGAGSIQCGPTVMDKLENRVAAKHRDLVLPSELRILPMRAGGVLEYRATLNGRALGLVETVREIERDVTERDRLLDQQERELFEKFLSGETHEHLRSRLREANTLVERITEQLEQRRTSGGMQVRLRWHVTDEAPAGTTAAIDLLMRSARLLAETDREALRRFLQQRLGEARARDSVGPLEERMLAVLDYRSWFGFTVESRAAGQDWKPLTRKSHAAGSGGQKAVIMHLPLFAAAAAFYQSAASTAPRLIVLDEAFAGIDKPMRGKLMGLLAEFDLDFVMTSYEEWGFYAELDGISTYHLARAEGMRGVYCDWFLWDGHEARQIETT